VGALRIAITDYSGHPFQVQLSRELARRGHSVLHLHFADFLTPKGRLAVGPVDPPTLEIAAITLDEPFAKYSLLRRRFQEVEIGKRLGGRIADFAPDVVIGCNLPLDSLNQLVRWCRSRKWPFVFWQQDIYSTAIGKILTRKMGFPGRLFGAFYRRMERRALKQSTAIVVIADEFLKELSDTFGISRTNVHIIENWAPLAEMPQRPKRNAWGEKHGLDGAEVVLYSGTLGLKHDASKLLSLAEALRTRPRSVLVVASEGLSADWLAAESKARNLPNLVVLPFQPFEAYPDVLGSADVLVALLEADAGSFSVPSKVLSYLCAGRAIVISAPRENLAFRIIEHSKAGRAVGSEEVDAFVSAVIHFLDDERSRQDAARCGRSYAEVEFDIVRIGGRFEQILVEAARKH
jgi:glycosyltransferase involved in cell wall biosynthesis